MGGGDIFPHVKNTYVAREILLNEMTGIVLNNGQILFENGDLLSSPIVSRVLTATGARQSMCGVM